MIPAKQSCSVRGRQHCRSYCWHAPKSTSISGCCSSKGRRCKCFNCIKRIAKPASSRCRRAAAIEGETYKVTDVQQAAAAGAAAQAAGIVAEADWAAASCIERSLKDNVSAAASLSFSLRIPHLCAQRNFCLELIPQSAVSAVPSEEREAALTLEGRERKQLGLADGLRQGKS